MRQSDTLTSKKLTKCLAEHLIREDKPTTKKGFSMNNILKRPSHKETNGQFNARVFMQLQKLSRASQGKLTLLNKLVHEIAARAEDLEDPIRVTIISHLRYHLKTYRTTVSQLERSLMLIAQAGQHVPDPKTTMIDATFRPLKKPKKRQGPRPIKDAPRPRRDNNES